MDRVILKEVFKICNDCKGIRQKGWSHSLQAGLLLKLVFLFFFFKLNYYRVKINQMGMNEHLLIFNHELNIGIHEKENSRFFLLRGVKVSQYILQGKALSHLC